MIVGYRELIYTLVQERERLRSLLGNFESTEEAEPQNDQIPASCCGVVQVQNNTMTPEEEEELKRKEEILDRIQEYRIKEAKYRIRVDQIYNLVGHARLMNNRANRGSNEEAKQTEEHKIQYIQDTILIRYLMNYYENQFKDITSSYYPECRLLERRVEFQNAIRLLTNSMREIRLEDYFMQYVSIAWYNTRISRSATNYRNAIKMYYFTI